MLGKKKPSIAGLVFIAVGCCGFDLVEGHWLVLRMEWSRLIQEKPKPTTNLFVLQVLPAIINDIKEPPPNIVRMKYDFFTPQLVKSA